MKKESAVAAAIIAMLGIFAYRNVSAGPMENTKQFMDKAIRTATSWPDDLSDYVTGTFVHPPKDMSNTDLRDELKESMAAKKAQKP